MVKIKLGTQNVNVKYKDSYLVSLDRICCCVKETKRFKINHLEMFIYSQLSSVIICLGRS